MSTNNNFTLVRLILATLVIFGHFKTLSGAPSPGIYGYADFAVDAFFIVSGYLVYSSFDNSPKLKGFYIKRFFRIYPLYFMMVILQAGIMMYLLGDANTLKDIATYLGANLIFANFISPDMGSLLDGMHNQAINPSLWTLKVEAAFYIMVPFVWWIVKKYGFKVVPIIYVLSTLFTLFALYQLNSDTLAKQLPGQLRFFVVGIALYHFRDAFQISPAKAFAFAVILFAICSYRFELPYLLPIYPILVGALVFICVLRLPVIHLKYDISYGVYLIHAPLIQLALFFGIFVDSIWFLLALWAVVYILAFFAEKFIELPMIALGKKYAKKAE